MTLTDADRADRDGWTAHTMGRADLRDVHWHYRDVIRRALTWKDHDMTDDDFTPIEVDDDVLLRETGDADPEDATGDWTDNTDDDEDGDPDAVA